MHAHSNSYLHIQIKTNVGIAAERGDVGLWVLENEIIVLIITRCRVHTMLHEAFRQAAVSESKALHCHILFTTTVSSSEWFKVSLSPKRTCLITKQMVQLNKLQTSTFILSFYE
jgi:hypothetical protein